MPGPVIYVVRSWPRLSQTFVLNEVLALERRGAELAIFSLVDSGETVVHPQVADVRARVTVLTRPRRDARARWRAHRAVFRAAPRRYVATLLYAMRHPALAEGYGSCTTRECFGHAVTVAAEVFALRAAGRPPAHLHAHFAHDPALVGVLAARLTRLSFSFTGHARDLLQIPAAALAARAAEATTVVTCCEANADHVRGSVPPLLRPPVLVVHHGVELDRFRPAATRRADGHPTLVSVGRLVEKKGYDDLLLALAGLQATGTRFRCLIHGDGPLRNQLLELRDVLGLQTEVALLGACEHDRVVEALAGADAFVLTPHTTTDGDRDGIPNVLVEAMASAVPVVTTTTGGIPELVRHGQNGLLTAPRDVPAVTRALHRLLHDPALRDRLGRAGRRTVEEEFDVDTAARVLQGVFGLRDLTVAGAGAP